MKKKKFIRKICLLGDGGVGKTSLVRRFVYDFFSDEYITSFGTKVTKKVLDLGEVELTLMIWDILGQKTHRTLHHAYYKGANGALLVCDLTREETIRNLVEWRDDFFRVVGSVPVLAIANKNDLENQVSDVTLAEIANVLGQGFVKTSAKTGEGVQEAFIRLGKALMEGES
ncbi:MAG: Rab family GTPase [Methanomassiliicoccales archaeon]|jgi:small GTP-binding protein|nr:Rab family GTPase [Methanomassiliicoccales archaeon]